MPGVTPYQQGSNAALKTVGLSPGLPGSDALKPGNIGKLTTPPAPDKFPAAGRSASVKGAAFSMSPNPETRAQEAQRDNVRQPPTNEDRRVATGIDPAFNYLGSPSESDPYTIPRLF